MTSQVVRRRLLTVFKSTFDRPQDRVDITAMLRAGSVDTDEAGRWVEELAGPEARGRLALLVDESRSAAP